MTEAVESAPADETAAFAAMQKGEDQPGSDQLPKPPQPEDGTPTPEPGSKETAEAAPAAAEPDKKLVDARSLDEERIKRKAAQEAARLKDTELTEARARLKQIAEMQRAVLPNADEDPVAANRAIVQMIEQHNAQQQTMVQAQEILALSAQHEGEYARQFPEYNDAVKYLHKQVIGEMMAFQGMNEAQATAAAAVAAAQIAQQAMNAGINPAVPMMRLAQMRGFVVSAPAAANPAPAAPQEPTASEKLLTQAANTLTTIAAGQQAARSGAGMRGGADAPPSLREIAELSNSDDPADIKRVEEFWKSGDRKSVV